MLEDLENLLSRAVTSNRSRMGEDVHLWAERLAGEAVVDDVGDAPVFVTTFTPAVQPPMPGEKCQTCGHKKPRKEG